MYYRAAGEDLCGHCAYACPKNNIHDHSKKNHPTCCKKVGFKWILKDGDIPEHPCAKNWQDYTFGMASQLNEPNDFKSCGKGPRKP